MSKNVILVDYQVPENWDYHRAIEKETGTSWDIVTCILLIQNVYKT